jgi:hypothetical protein
LRVQAAEPAAPIDEPPSKLVARSHVDSASKSGAQITPDSKEVAT